MAQVPLTLRRWQRAEYDRLVDLGVFAGEPIELIGGQLLVAEPQAPYHASTIGMVDDALRAMLPAGWLVRCQAPLSLDDERHPRFDSRYAKIPADQLPATECLKDTVARVLPFWNESIAPAIRAGRKVLIAAHGNSLRALIKHLDNVSDDDIVNLNIPTGQPLVYELDDDLRPIRHYYLGDAAEIEAAMAAVAAQGKAKKD